MAVCSGLWRDVGAWWSLGSCGVSGGLVVEAGLLDLVPGSAGADSGAGAGLSLGLRAGTGGLGWVCSRRVGGFLVRGGVEGRTGGEDEEVEVDEEEEEEGWTS